VAVTVYDRISRAYDVLAERPERSCRERAIAALRVAVGERVLEIGAGTGHGVQTLSRLVGCDRQVIGLDRSAGMLKSARLVLASHPNVRLVRGDARRLCFAAGAFDAVLMSFTLELFDASDMARVLAEVARVLRVGGRLSIVALAEPRESNTITTLYQWVHAHFPSIADCRPIDLPAVVECAGFQVRGEETMRMCGLLVAVVIAQMPA
jgi:demethylmenaquinone methyltransferase / 2-methoxy-6-polyprenyl-1,4-benzoquinol methylase